MTIPEFSNPWFLLLLILAAAAAFFSYWKKQPSILFPDLAPIAKKRFQKLSPKLMIPWFLIFLSLAFIVVALARPRQGLEEIRRRSDGIDIIIALDVSGSMAAIDLPSTISTRNQLNIALATGKIAPRLDVAKKEIAKFIKARPADRIGLVVFAQQPYMACPPTLDHAWLLSNLENLTPGIIGDQTGIAGPIASATKRLKDSDSKRKIIVLFTDGANNISANISPQQAAKLSKTFDIRVYTVGIGADNTIYPQKTHFGVQYVPVQSGFDEPLLREIAETSGGRYYHADDPESMKAAMDEIDSLEKTTFEQQTTMNWRELAFPLIAAALAILILAFLLENTIFLRAP
ncbi:MAG: VWA domain-containing protein [Lentisphaeria bacterium]|nr:VWA domain-containing protein [Lentisphaeria bacterium]MBQ7404779.1 VWA domain-containing protein [Lentisphaeria bacterium]